MKKFYGDCLDGSGTWSVLQWDIEKALALWKDDLDEMLSDCMTLQDCCIAFYFFKYDTVVNTLGNGKFKKIAKKVYTDEKPVN